MLGISADAAIIGVGGIGIRVQMATADLAVLSGRATVYTVLHVREDEVHLFGFATEEGRQLFKALTSVNGVGPRLALAILSFHPPAALERVLAAGDADALALVSGVGKKTAQRVVLELKDKLGVVQVETASGAAAEVREALKGLGYTAQEVQDVVAQLPADGDAPTLLRHALRVLGAKEPAVMDR